MERKIGGKALNWADLGFEYVRTDWRFSARWRDGQWGEGKLLDSEIMPLHEGSPALHYAQECFEGMKAQSARDGRVLLFRPELNSERLKQAAGRLLMPEVPTDLFMRGVETAVRENREWIPPFGSGASLYVRPMLIGVGDNLGLRPAKEFEFRVFVSPVGPYYKQAGLAPIALAVSEMDRAALMARVVSRSARTMPAACLQRARRSSKAPAKRSISMRRKGAISTKPDRPISSSSCATAAW